MHDSAEPCLQLLITFQRHSNLVYEYLNLFCRLWLGWGRGDDWITWEIMSSVSWENWKNVKKQMACWAIWVGDYTLAYICLIFIYNEKTYIFIDLDYYAYFTTHILTPPHTPSSLLLWGFSFFKKNDRFSFFSFFRFIFLSSSHTTV